MIDRRNFTKSSLAVAGLSLWGAQTSGAKAQEVNEDGLHVQPWFQETFFDLADDLSEAKEAGKRLVLLWEQRGCPYCREMHNVNFKNQKIVNFITANFMVIQLNLWGSREVTDFDGTAMEERAIARRWGVNFTPTIMFLGEDIKSGQTARDLEVARMPGYFKPFHFISMFEFVREKSYENQGFQRFLQDKFARLKAEGKDPSVW